MQGTPEKYIPWSRPITSEKIGKGQSRQEATEGRAQHLATVHVATWQITPKERNSRTQTKKGPVIHHTLGENSTTPREREREEGAQERKSKQSKPEVHQRYTGGTPEVHQLTTIQKDGSSDITTQTARGWSHHHHNITLPPVFAWTSEPQNKTSPSDRPQGNKIPTLHGKQTPQPCVGG